MCILTKDFFEEEKNDKTEALVNEDMAFGRVEKIEEVMKHLNMALKLSKPKDFD